MGTNDLVKIRKELILIDLTFWTSDKSVTIKGLGNDFSRSVGFSRTIPVGACPPSMGFAIAL